MAENEVEVNLNALCEDIEKLANSFIREKSDFLSNSMMSNAAQAILL